jgi:hypothetical protein
MPGSSCFIPRWPCGQPSHAVDKSFNLSFVLAEDNFEAAPARTVPAHQAPGSVQNLSHFRFG